MALEWKDIESRPMSWHEAKELEADGWRLPSRGELLDAYDNKIEGFGIEKYWTSTCKWNSDAYFIYFKTGDIWMDAKEYYLHYVRLCRDLN